MKYTSQLCCDQTKDDKMSVKSRMLFSELCKFMVNKITFAGCRGGDCPQSPTLDPPLLQTTRSSNIATTTYYQRYLTVHFGLNPSVIFNIPICNCSYFTAVFLKRLLSYSVAGFFF